MAILRYFLDLSLISVYGENTISQYIISHKTIKSQCVKLLNFKEKLNSGKNHKGHGSVYQKETS